MVICTNGKINGSKLLETTARKKGMRVQIQRHFIASSTITIHHITFSNIYVTQFYTWSCIHTCNAFIHSEKVPVGGIEIVI